MWESNDSSFFIKNSSKGELASEGYGFDSLVFDRSFISEPGYWPLKKRFSSARIALCAILFFTMLE